MKKYTKALICALILILIGTAIASVVFAVGGTDAFFSPSKLRDEKTQITEDFSSIEINGSSDDIRILPSPDGSCSAVCFDGKKVSHGITVENGILKIKRTDERKWYENFLPAKNDNGITLYLPDGEYDDLNICVSSGNVNANANNVRFKNVKCDSSSGETELINLTVDNDLTVKSTSGEVSIGNSKIAGRINVETSSGEIELGGVNAGECALMASSGDVSTENVIIKGDMTVMTSSGDAEFENVTVDGDLTVNTSSGDVEFERTDVKGEKTVRTSSGDISYDN